MLNSAPQIQARQILDIVYPIGIIQQFYDDTNPNDIMHGQTWVKLENVFLYGSGTKSIGTTGGEATHTLTINEMPRHRHRVKDGGDNWNGNCGSVSRHDIRGVGGITNNGGYSDTIGNSGMQILENTGGGQAHNNMPPYRVVGIWRRTA